MLPAPINQAAKYLNISRKTLIYRMEKFGLQPATDRQDSPKLSWYAENFSSHVTDTMLRNCYPHFALNALKVWCL